jgi:hypothetical protein
MFLGKRKNGYYFIQYTDPSDDKIRRKSTGTRSKGEANRILRNFTPGFPEKAKLNKLSDLDSATCSRLIYYSLYAFP